jgi:protein SCO1/2
LNHQGIDRGRLGLLALLAAAAVLLIAAALFVTGVLGGQAPLTGTDLGQQPAPDFMLTDHRGQHVRLSDLHGKAVALTFIYTNCPDICPLVAENLRVALEILPEDTRSDVALLAVTLDPERDTQQALQGFTAIHRLANTPNWFALRGDPATLAQVWRDYGIFPGLSSTSDDGTPTVGGGMGHTDAIYLIDPEGRERVFLRSSVTPQEIADNLAALVD